MRAFVLTIGLYLDTMSLYYFALSALLLVPLTVADSACDTSVSIAGRRYAVSILLNNTDCYKNIVEDKHGSIFYRDWKLYKLMLLKAGDKVAVPISGFDGVDSLDCAKDSQDNIYFATGNGIYKFDYQTISAISVMAKGYNIYRLSFARNGTLYVADSNDKLYSVTNNTLTYVPISTKVSAFALSNEGDIYTGNWKGIEPDVNIVKTATMKATEITGVNVHTTYVIGVDRKDDIAYFGCSTGFYYYKPEDNYMKLIDGFREVSALGFGTNGVMYVGQRGATQQLLKLMPYEEDPCKSSASIMLILSTEFIFVHLLSLLIANYIIYNCNK